MKRWYLPLVLVVAAGLAALFWPDVPSEAFPAGWGFYKFLAVVVLLAAAAGVVIGDLLA